ncbi:MAG: hypothetical protein HKK67_03020 [Chlorobiaceae bacterium]|nr:hypothetical protein [Chlorobiaceae bacterium]
MKNIALFIAVFILGLSLAQPVQASDFKKPLHFAPGKNSAIVSAAVVRGDRDIYLIKAHAKQVMTINISTLEENAVFSLFEPKAKNAVRGTEEGKDITTWSGSLSKTGLYRIIVGGTRGNASYKLQVTVK